MKNERGSEMKPSLRINSIVYASEKIDGHTMFNAILQYLDEQYEKEMKEWIK